MRKGPLDSRAAADLAAQPGRYLITPSGLTAANYRLVFLDGILTVFDPTAATAPTPAAPPAVDTANDESVIAARRNQPSLPPIAGLARLDIVESGIRLPAEAGIR